MTHPTTPATGSNGDRLTLEARNASLQDLMKVLNGQRARTLDVVAPATQVHARNGLIELSGTGIADLSEDGVTAAAGLFRPLAQFDYGISDKLDIPIRYIRWMRENRPDLYDANVNGLLHGSHGGRDDSDGGSPGYPPDDRKFMLRLFRGDGDGQGPGIARAFLSNSYRVVDNLDVLMALLAGVKGAQDDGEIKGKPEIRNLNLSEDRMHVRVTVPELATTAPAFTKGYQNPFRDGGATRAGGWQPPSSKPRRGDVVWAGLDLTNSELGSGAFVLTPVVQVCICDNGQVVTREAMRTVHLGSKLEEGIINWSEDTRQANLKLIIAKTRDAVRTILSQANLERLVAGLEQQAGAKVTDPAATIQVVSRKCGFSDAEQALILEHFTLGGQLTAAGVANAVTSAAQAIPSPGQALDLEYKSLLAMEHAAELAAA